MSTYAVFGMTVSRARDNAKKQLEPYNAALQRMKTMDEVVTEIAARTVQLSDTFDAPHFADQFLEMAKREESRGLHVKAHCFTGELDPKTKKPIRKWVEVGTDAERQIQERPKAGSLL